jgi:hypothetical protein
MKKSESKLLTIRSVQHEALVKMKVDQFKMRVFKYLRTNFEVQTKAYNDSQLFELIDEGVKKAERYGFIHEEYIVKLIEWMILIQEDFDTCQQTDWAYAILTDQNFQPDEKVQQINESYLRHLQGD